MKYLELMIFYPPGKGPAPIDIESQVLGTTDEYAYRAICDGLHGNAPGAPIDFQLTEGLILRLSAKDRELTWIERLKRWLSPSRYAPRQVAPRLRRER